MACIGRFSQHLDLKIGAAWNRLSAISRYFPAQKLEELAGIDYPLLNAPQIFYLSEA